MAVTVHVSKHLFRFFPVLERGPIVVEATTAAEAVHALDALAPGVAGYVVDERGALRRHVNIFVGGEMIADRKTLSDRVPDGGTVHILQALSGG